MSHSNQSARKSSNRRNLLSNATRRRRRIPIEKTIEHNFPGALRDEEMFKKLKDIAKREGFDKNTIYAESMCSDEINHEKVNLSSKLERFFNGAFQLGGLAGVPFTGRTGWGAFSHHIPENGNLFVVVAPHIGLTQQGTWGKIERRGQSQASTACGASVGAYGLCNQSLKELHCDSDMQMCYLVKEIKKRKKSIDHFTDPNDRQIAIVKEMFDIAWNGLESLLATNHYRVCVVGGIQINTSKGNYFQPLKLEIRNGPKILTSTSLVREL